MSVVITFKDGSRAEQQLQYQDGDEGRDYRYVIGGNGTLSIFGKEEKKRLVKDQQPDIVYGPGAWFSVEGDALTRKDEYSARAASF